jgi:signal transduction histidine kinase
MTKEVDNSLGAVAVTVRGAAMAVLALGLAVLSGYVLKRPSIVDFGPAFQGMSPLTAMGLGTLAIAVLALSWRRRRIARAAGSAALSLGAGLLLEHAIAGEDAISPAVAHWLFGYDPSIAGRMSLATAACLSVLGFAVLNRSNAKLADSAAGAALLVSWLAVIGYAYGVQDLYAVPMFNTMAIHTAVAITALSVALIIVHQDAGWASVITSREAGGAATRRQLAFILLPPIAGWCLLGAADAHRLGPGAAMAFLVILTIVPLALLILRDGQVLNALEREQRDKAQLQAGQAEILKRRLAEQAAALARESAERVKAEAAMYQAQRMDAVGQLTGGIAHDFNNLLMAIGGNLHLLAKRLPEDHPALRYANNAALATERGAKLTGQLLAFSRTQKMDIQPVELDQALRNACALFGNAMGPSIQLELRLEAKGCWASTDPHQLELAILNLAVNARDAMPGGGSLIVESGLCRTRLAAEQDEANFLSIQVRDTGEGMSQAVADQAAQPFFTTKQRGKGTGLGLAQVYGFVRQSQGDMRIRSTLGAGTTIELLLPTVDPPADRPARRSQADGGMAQSRGEGRLVLVIDDDDDVRAVLVETLVAAGFTVAEANSGAEGLRHLETKRPDAAIIDFIMPGMNGAEIAQSARAILPDLPIVFVSGYFDTVALDGIEGAIILRKPFDVESLRRAVSSAMN